jgi:putative FmdB family regulatory protein
MPLFDFRCTECHTTTEKIVKTDVEYIECPKCSSKAVKQLSAPGGFDLKGSGWYKPGAN